MPSIPADPSRTLAPWRLGFEPETGLSLLDEEQSLGIPSLIGGAISYGVRLQWQAVEVVEQSDDRIELLAELDGVLEQTIVVERVSETAATITLSFTNRGPELRDLEHAWLEPAKLGDTSLTPVVGEAHAWTLRCYHPNNLRLERLPHSRPEVPALAPVPAVPTWFGDDQSQAIPAMVLTDIYANQSLLVGQLQQNLTRLRFKLAARPNGGMRSTTDLLDTFVIDWRALGSPLVIGPGETVSLEPVLLEARRQTQVEDAFQRYHDLVESHNDFTLQGDANVLNRVATYCSWNYGIFRDISEESLLKTARTVADQLPGMPFFLIDGGWRIHPNVRAHIGEWHLGADQVCDPEKFPNGMKVMADKLRDLGLRPGLHWLGFVDLGSGFAAAHPDWLARHESGTIYRLGNCGFFDYSLPEVQAFFTETIGIIWGDWGYEACKFDFWSQSCDDQSIRYRHGGTGTQWRDWLLGAIQKQLPDDGYLMTGCATAMGNPFLGKTVQTYRCGIDVGACDTWNRHVMSSCWNLPLLSQPGRRFGLLSVDGLGISPTYTDDENLHRLTYGFITMGSLELDGRLEELAPRQLDWLQRLTAHIDRGHPCYSPDRRAFSGDALSEVLYVRYPEDSRTYQRGVAMHVAVLNWHDAPRYIGFTGADLGGIQTVEAREFWTDRRVTIEAEAGLCELVPPHAARLWELPVR